MDLIIFLIIFFVIWPKISKKFTANILELLNANDFQKVVKIKTTSSKTYYTAIKNGENYLIANLDVARNINIKDIEDIAKEKDQIHYHYAILITKNIYAESIKKYAEKKEIQIIYIMELFKNRNKNVEVNVNTGAENKIEEKINYKENNPIQEKKGNSIISNLFKKPDRL